MKQNTKAIGEQSEACILAALLLNNEVVLRPFGDNQRYDLVVDRQGVFVRIQCKTGRLVNGAVQFQTCNRPGGKARRSYAGQADFFGVYCHENRQVYMVPVSEAGPNAFNMRVDPPPYRPKSKAYKWACRYLYPQPEIRGNEAAA